MIPIKFFPARPLYTLYCLKEAFMCGITGFIEAAAERINPSIIEAMTNAIRHRGPNDYGTWYYSKCGLAFGHRRLSVLDLSPAGHQPMHSKSKRYVTIFNGELYNYQTVAGRLRGLGHSFRGHSDTEVLLAAVEEWGVTGAIKQFEGMFAIALWDNVDRKLFLIRDRIGKKPLYYGWSGGCFMFGSELKALTVHPKFTAEVDRGALGLFMQLGYIPTPWSIFTGFYKMVPGTVLTLDQRHFTGAPASFSPFPDQSSALSPKRFWDLRQLAADGGADPFTGDESSAASQLEDLLRSSVEIRMLADVPLGAFLSGGIDSSTVVALMQTQSEKPVKTFSIGFHEENFNEAGYASNVASHLGTQHTELFVTSRDALNVIPDLPEMFDEPFSDSSQIPTFLVSKMAREHVTVALTGDGADELFGGYDRYSWARDNWRRLQFLPNPMRQLVSKFITSVSPAYFVRFFEPLEQLVGRPVNIGHKFLTLSKILGSQNEGDFYLRLMSLWESPSALVKGITERRTVFDEYSALVPNDNCEPRMMLADLLSYLPDDIMVKVDRSSMAVSLETRAPFLDHRVVEFSLRLPQHFKSYGGETKRIVRKILSRYLPASIFERPKMGFALPIGQWLRTDLREWAEGLLNEELIESQGFLSAAPIRRRWIEHLSGHHNWEHSLWSVLSFQSWLQINSNRRVVWKSERGESTRAAETFSHASVC